MNLRDQLKEPRYYKQVFAALRRKVRENPKRLSTSYVEQEVTLGWVLQEEELITKFLISEISSGVYFPQPANAQTIHLDKQRIIYSQSWIDRIAEAVAALIIADIFEHTFHPRLFSFRKGRSSVAVVKEAGEFIALHRETPLSALKFDVASYDKNISVDKVLAMIFQECGPQDEYVTHLLRSFLSPTIRNPNGDGNLRLGHGLPTGFSLTPIVENIYLHQLDSELGAAKGAFYARYGDDVLFMHPNAEVVCSILSSAQSILSSLNLSFKESKLQLLTFAEQPVSELGHNLLPASSFDYLGFNLNREGEIFLSTRKLHELKQELRRCARLSFLENRNFFRDKIELSNVILQSLSMYLDRRLLHPHFSYLLSITTNEKALRQLDRWIAKQALRFVFGSGHDRVFRHRSLKSIRGAGLSSLIFLRDRARRHRGLNAS